MEKIVIYPPADFYDFSHFLIVFFQPAQKSYIKYGKN